MIKKIMKDTVGISIGAVGIGATKNIDGPMGNLLGTTMGAGLVKKVYKK